jgi:hypothetical protein
LGFLETAERLEETFAPMPPSPRRLSRGGGKKAQKKKAKQPKIKCAFKKMLEGPKNFQGMFIDKCTEMPELSNKPVFIHKNYIKYWEKKSKQHAFMLHERFKPVVCCPKCFLKPCSAIVLKPVLTHDIIEQDDMCSITITREEMTKKLRFAYRIELAKLQGKQFVNRLMPTDDSIPECAKSLVDRIVDSENGGYTSWLEDEAYDPFGISKKAKNKKMKKVTEEVAVKGKEEGVDSDDESCFDEEAEFNAACDHDGTLQTQMM